MNHSRFCLCLPLLPLLLLFLVVACSGEPAEPLALVVTAPAATATVGTAQVTVTGYVNRSAAGVAYTVNGSAARSVAITAGKTEPKTPGKASVFSFDVALEPGQNTVLVTATASGAEDSALLTVTSAPVVAGELSAASPTFTRPDDGGGLDAAARTNAYSTYTFSVARSGWYTLLSRQTFDGYLLLYRGTFDPAAPTTNLVDQNDDYLRGFDPQGDPPGQSFIRAELAAGVSYVVVTTACGDPAAGCGPNLGSFTTRIAPAEPPPPTFQLPAPDATRYNITVRFTTDNLTKAQQAVFTEAAERWAAIITKDVVDISFAEPTELSAAAAPVQGTLDDLLIDAAFREIDGPGGTLGRAGPRFVRAAGGTDAHLTLYGTMEFDVAEFEPGGAFENPKVYADTVVHEMGHVIGIGTLWTLTQNTAGVQESPPTVNPGLPNPAYDPRFTGKAATTEYQTLLAAAGLASEPDVPIANTGGPGNYNGHWRELTFDDELMTPYLGGNELLSRLTAASLGDVGYTVDVDATAVDQSYALPTPVPTSNFIQTAPTLKTYQENVDYVRAGGSSGSAAGAVQAVDLKLATGADPKNPASNHPANASSACEAADFAGFVPGNIALVQRGECSFVVKVQNAVAAGAAGVVLFNQGDVDNFERSGLFKPDVGDSGLPVVATPFALGVGLAATAGSRVSIATPASTSTLSTSALSTLRVAGKAVEFDEEVLQPVGVVSDEGAVKFFLGR